MVGVGACRRRRAQRARRRRLRVVVGDEPSDRGAQISLGSSQREATKTLYEAALSAGHA